MTALNIDDYICKVPDFPTKGILFYDITGILTTPKAFCFCIDRMIEIYGDKKFGAVAAIEARGFVFASPFAYRMGIPLILVRKKGKLPRKTSHKSFELEYGSAEIEINPDDIKKDSRILIVDDLIATGGTLQAACELLTEAGAITPEIFGVVGLPFLGYGKKLGDTKVTTLIDYNTE
ncbi:MAG: adenine phosphoribosyltransferase [Spirochaetaceae bacterium]|jgi:adenine phosphoribosyltransferase|nr:adenine phosphoribosyltransferase [Spirochaetaceae bacterium]